ncbi:MAG: cytochrome c3 family protein [Gemmatimonadales bacterium]
MVAVVGGFLLTTSCTTEKIVFRDRDPFNPPPDASSGFLGYFTVATQQTTCGNCHVEKQTAWASTKHSEAWEDLQASGHAAASCNGCHTVSERGNSIGKAAGYNVVADSAYHDVQCENCHGPGQTHVTNPNTSNRPLASIAADTGQLAGCGGCHSGTHEPFVEQWKASGHGSGPGFNSAAANASCAPCHEGKAAMEQKFGVANNYVEKGSTTPTRIVCVTCHDPHGSDNPAQLRRSISIPTTDNLCISCHSRKATPPWSQASGATGTARGGHGAQGLLVLGENVGWIPPGFVYDTSLIVSSHGSAANPRLCATCHVVRTTITDKATGAFQFQSVGHLFNATPCLDGQGIPTAETNCALAQKDFSACAASGCHASQQSARTAYNAFQARLDNLLTQLWDDKDGDKVIDPSPTDGGLLAQMVARNSAADIAALDFSSATTTVAKGALFNAALAANDDHLEFLSGKAYGRTFSTHPASGNGVHNPFLLEALLTASISAVRAEYGFPAPPNLDLKVQATMPPGVKFRTGTK